MAQPRASAGAAFFTMALAVILPHRHHSLGGIVNTRNRHFEWCNSALVSRISNRKVILYCHVDRPTSKERKTISTKCTARISDRTIHE